MDLVQIENEQGGFVFSPRHGRVVTQVAFSQLVEMSAEQLHATLIDFVEGDKYIASYQNHSKGDTEDEHALLRLLMVQIVHIGVVNK